MSTTVEETTHRKPFQHLHHSCSPSPRASIFASKLLFAFYFFALFAAKSLRKKNRKLYQNVI